MAISTICSLQRFLAIWLVALGSLILAGCGNRLSPAQVYYASIERVETNVAYFSTADGSIVLSYVHLAVHGRTEGDASSKIVLHILGQYDGKRYGVAGDNVSFQTKALMKDGQHLNYDEIEKYKIVRGYNRDILYLK